MESRFNFVADKILQGKAYPALTSWQAQPYTPQWRQFGQHWPNTVPCELHEHCGTHAVPYTLLTLDDTLPRHCFYCVGLGFFNFDIDYFELMPHKVIEGLKTQQIQILFYYHEGDNPFKIKKRLDSLCAKHALSQKCYKFVSGNTAANKIKGFAWFPDHELLYWHRNRDITASSIHLNPRQYQFTALNRTHKWWRATVMADLQRNGLLDRSQWSYNTNLVLGDDPADNPIEIDTLNLRSQIEMFMKNGPYQCDTLSADQHNDHHLHVASHYTDSYCHIVIETHFDADQSGGAFLTEKTFKPIKHGQPFVVVGAPGSLAALKRLGYRTFDHAIDNSYDLETNNTRRWQMLLQAIKKIQQQDLDKWFKDCLDDVCHNQTLFLKGKQARLNMLTQRLGLR